MDRKKTNKVRLCVLSEQEETEELEFDKWAKREEQWMREQAENIENGDRPFFTPKDFIYDGFQAICQDLANIYKALGFLYEIIHENDGELAQHLKTLLGLTGKVTDNQIEERAKELNELNQIIKKIVDVSKRKKIEAEKEKGKNARFYVR